MHRFTVTDSNEIERDLSKSIVGNYIKERLQAEFVYIYISQFVGGLPVVSLRFCDSVASARSDVPAPRSGNSAEGGRVEGLPGKYQGPLVNGHPYPKPR